METFEKLEGESEEEFIDRNKIKARKLAEDLVLIRNNLKIFFNKYIYIPTAFTPDDKALVAYEKIGQLLLAEKKKVTIDDMKALSGKIYKKLSTTEQTIVPLLVVCSSSGTGKTQLPCNLDLPLLYFTVFHKIQPIYQTF